MKEIGHKKHYTNEQVIGVLNESESGLTIKEFFRRHGFSEQRFYLWRNKFGRMNVSDAKPLYYFLNEVSALSNPVYWFDFKLIFIPLAFAHQHLSCKLLY